VVGGAARNVAKTAGVAVADPKGERGPRRRGEHQWRTAQAITMVRGGDFHRTRGHGIAIRNAGPQPTLRAAGICQVPSRIEGSVSFGQ
jgi:hypothetical protein